MKLCVIGNTHLAAFRSGWDALRHDPTYADLHIDFFTSQKDTISNLAYDDGVLFAEDPDIATQLAISSRGASSIKISDYDCIILYGLISFNKIARTFCSSGAARENLVEYLGGKSSAIRYHRHIESMGVPVVICAEPLFCQGVMNSANTYGYENILDSALQLREHALPMVADWNEYVRKHDIVQQASNTIEKVIFTSNKFRMEANDNLHMNQTFGTLQVKFVLNKVKDKVGVVASGKATTDEDTAFVLPKSPYRGLPDEAYWKLAVADRDESSISGLYVKRFAISGMRIATAGSCFAQEIAKGLRKHGYEVIDKEPSPGTRVLRGNTERKYGYGLYSARHGNIYTVRQLLQLTRESLGLATYPPQSFVWAKEGRYFDAFRPNVEPEGLATQDEVLAQRQDHLQRFKRVLNEADIFIFTMGLTETWINKVHDVVYPTAPGVIAGQYDPEIYEFKDFSHDELFDDFATFRELAHSLNPKMKFIVTVSPVPLTATASGKHVLVSTVQSKSILRAVAAKLYREYEDIDYFPSYELFSTPFLGKSLFKDNRRNVTSDGVDAVMKVFFGEHGTGEVSGTSIPEQDTENDPVCEEAMLEAFAGRGR